MSCINRFEEAIMADLLITEDLGNRKRDFSVSYREDDLTSYACWIAANLWVASSTSVWFLSG